MNATTNDLDAITDQLRAAIRPDIKVTVAPTLFNPYNGTPERTHYRVTAEIPGDNAFTLTDWYPAENEPDEVVASALRMIGRLRPAPEAGDTIEHGGREILVQFVEVTAQGNWKILGRFIDGEDIEALADVLVTPFNWEEA